MGVTAIECAVCAWRATCNLKFKYEGSSSLHCPEFTRDLSIPSSHENPIAQPPDDTTRTKNKKIQRKNNPKL